ncbi:MAG: PhnD/SsuA/transferrin family substrate-binding protein [Burkholderiales bacterium]|nr:PhnD/SsuA/transferrin family substrate-binding protein [Burkholderiales bacterium]
MSFRVRHLLLLIWLVGSTAQAALNTMVAVEPTSRMDSLRVSREAVETSLGRSAGQEINVSFSEDLTDVMRATRTGEYDIFIAPPQVAASALTRGFELVGSTEAMEQYVLVARASLTSVAALKGRRLYLPQQDSIYTYMARGLLNAGGLSVKDMKVEHARWPAAGLVSLGMGQTDATVVRRSEWDSWSRDNPRLAAVLATSTPVPGGLSVVVKKDLPTTLRERLARWFTGPAPATGLKAATQRAELSQYRTVAELGYFTPTLLPGATLVAAKEVQQLIANGAVMVDTRSEKEYKARHIPKAVLVPYHEKSLKDVAFDASKDDFAGLATLDKSKPTVFACNGAECWKSYKASKAAVAAGFKQVYWFRGGLPEWEATFGASAPSQ